MIPGSPVVGMQVGARLAGQRGQGPDVDRTSQPSLEIVDDWADAQRDMFVDPIGCDQSELYVGDGGRQRLIAPDPVERIALALAEWILQREAELEVRAGAPHPGEARRHPGGRCVA